MSNSKGLDAVRAGDKVRLFDVNGTQYGMPPAGWPGKVAKVGRTLLHVADSRWPGGDTSGYRIADGSASDRSGMTWIMTVEEAEHTVQMEAARKFLLSAGFRTEYGQARPSDNLVLQVAAFVASCQAVQAGPLHAGEGA